ncbi:MAG: hypothetical protein CYG61_05460 [Actinobacteria bacterium]|nr:MAG: hypothetical protein CYG61_05460 [Actinomycetota bacterium]
MGDAGPPATKASGVLSSDGRDTDARLRHQEGQAVLRGPLRGHRPGHRQGASPLGQGRHQAGRRRAARHRTGQAQERRTRGAPGQGDGGQVPHREVAPDPTHATPPEHLRLLRAQRRQPRRARIGRIQLAKLTPEDLDSLYATLLTSGRRDGKSGGLKPKTVRSTHLVIHKALSDAHRKGTVVRNVAAPADPPKLSAAKRPDMKVWTADQLRRFLDAVRDTRTVPAFFLAAHTGMRRGEVLGLRWSDVHLNEGRLGRQALISVAYEMQLSDVKTGSSRRTIGLDSTTVEVLRRWRKNQAEEKVLAGAAYDDSGLVFCRADGRLLHPDLFSQTFDRAVAKCDVAEITLHDLRHTHATSFKAGVPVKVVSERLGHSSPAFTMTVYQHVIPGMQAEAAAVFAALVADADEAAA